MNDEEVCPISQQDLAFFETLRSELREIRRRYLAKRSEIIEKLSRGGEVEPGPFRAFIRINARLAVE
jgi:hypothetical protein